MARYAASLQYNGSVFYGWQRLNTLPTVQQVVENALSRVASHPISVVCAGRTDSGVHGCNQIIHYDTEAVRDSRSWMLGANSYLPPTVAVNWVKPVTELFHARWSALWRRYRYVIYDGLIRPVHLRGFVTLCIRRLDEVSMKEGAGSLQGTHDFTSYRAAHCQAKNPRRTVLFIDVKRFGDYVVVDIQANAFLYRMVRNIVGVLMAVGMGRQKVSWVQQVLNMKNRQLAGVTARPDGLYFIDVGYPEEFQLPREVLGPAFLKGFY